MMCRICGYNLNKTEIENCDNYCKCCGICKSKHSKNQLTCPNCGYVNYIESKSTLSIIHTIKEKLNIK